MIRPFPIGVILALLFVPIAAVADEETADLGEISVTAAPRVAGGLSVQRFTRKEIEEVPVGDAADFVGRMPAAQALGNRRGDRLLQLRGFDQQQLLVLIDGAPSAVPFDGVLDLGKFPLAMIERIEVIEGAGSVLYGPGGLGGAINIVTRTPRDAPLIDVAADGSPVHEIQASLVHGSSIGKFNYVLFGGFDDRKDFPLSGDFQPQANQGKGGRIGSGRIAGFGGGKVEVDLAPGHRLMLSGNAVGGRYDIPPSVSSPRPRYWRFDPWMAATAALTHRGSYLSEALEVTEDLFVSPFTNTLKSFDDAAYATQAGRGAFTSIYDDLAAGGFVRARGRVRPGGIDELVFRLWAGGRYERHGERAAGQAAETQYSHWLLTAAPQIDVQFSPKATLVAGVQVDAEVPDRFAGVIEPKNQVTAGPFASLSLHPTDAVDVELSAARRARFPTLKERFADAFGQRIPNPGLGAETAWNLSLGTKARLPADLSLAATAFASEIFGLVVRAPMAGGLYQLQNAGRARLAGVEASFEWRPLEGRLELQGGYHYLFAKRLDAAFPDSQLEYRPEHKAFAGVVWEFITGYSLSNEAVIIGPRPYLDPDSGQWGRLPTNATWNVRLEGAVAKWLKLTLAATNILDFNNTGEIGYPEPGRQIWAGMVLIRQ